MCQKSEIYFEEFLNQRKFNFEKIIEGTSKTPDYKIFFKKNTVVSEIKEFNIKKTQKNKISTMDPPGLNAIRDKIQKAKKQFENYSNIPTLLVLCNPRERCLDLSTPIILMAMFGDIEYEILSENFVFGRNAPPQIGRKEDSLISAVAVLESLYTNQKVIDDAIEDVVTSSKKKRCLPTNILKEALIKVEKIKNIHPDINFDKHEWRLRIILNPKAKKKFPYKCFCNKQDEIWVKNTRGFEKIKN